MTRWRRAGLLGLASCALVVGLVERARRARALPPWLEPLRDDYRKRLSALHVRDGVSQAEAEEIARIYLSEYISGCGAVLGPERRDGTWTARLRLGFAGTPSDRTIQVSERDGAVSSTGGPRFDTFGAFATDVVEGMAERRRSLER